MDTVIGLGKAGCAIAKDFAQYPQYSAYMIDVGLEMTDNTFKLSEHSVIEDYEKECPDLSRFLEGVVGDVLFVVGGGGKVSLTSLSILEQIKHCSITVLYIKPEEEFLGSQGKIINNLVFNIFQEYARSGVFDRLYIVENTLIERAIPPASIKDFYRKLNEAIVSSLHMINVFNHIPSVTDTFSGLPAAARISTIGFVDPKKNTDKMFFLLDNVTDRVYYYACNKMRLETENNLFGEIKNSLKRKMEPDVRVSYGIFETDYDEDYIYCVNHTSVIQGQEKTIGGSEDLPTSP
jgi:hypothetical protein